MLDEPSFSPDGQRIVGRKPSTSPTSASRPGLYTVPVNTSTHPLTFVPGSAGLATADWIDTPGALTATTIVAADLAAPAGLLTLVNAASGERTSLPDTEGALDPMGQADGSVLFTTLSDTEGHPRAAPRRRDPHNTSQTWAARTARWPVTDPDTGDVLVYLEEPDLADPGSAVWSVSAVEPDAASTDATGLGVPDDDRTGLQRVRPAHAVLGRDVELRWFGEPRRHPGAQHTATSTPTPCRLRRPFLDAAPEGRQRVGDA